MDIHYVSFYLECDVCPDVLTTPEPLLEGEEYIEDNSGCCPILKKVCSPEKCIPQEECSEHLVKIEDTKQDACCPKYKCGMWMNN